jgi:hypothetical protein
MDGRVPVETRELARGVLSEARGLLAKGWIKGAYARRADGRPAATGSPEACQFCLAGAVLHVLQQRQKEAGYFPGSEVRDSLRDVLGVVFPPREVTQAEYDAGLSGDTLDQTFEFNDAEERTQHEVLAKIDLALEGLQG